MPYGYMTDTGYMGRLPDGKWMLFATYGDYIDYCFEELIDIYTERGKHDVNTAFDSQCGTAFGATALLAGHTCDASDAAAATALTHMADRGFCVAVDFDGTLCHRAWPGIGEPIMKIIRQVRLLQLFGIETVLWTCREGQSLQDALDWCGKWGLEFTCVNENTPTQRERWGNNPRKIGADEYWDDKAVHV